MSTRTAVWQTPRLIVLRRARPETPVLAACRIAGTSAPKAGYGECVTPMCNGCGTGFSS